MAATGSCKTVLAGSIAKSLQAEVAQGLQTLERPRGFMGFWRTKTLLHACTQTGPPKPLERSES